MIEALNLSAESAMAWAAKRALIAQPQPSFLKPLCFKKTDENRDEENNLTLVGQGNIQSESSFYEEPDWPYQMTPLQRAPVF